MQRSLYFQPPATAGAHGKLFSVNSKGKGAERGTWWVEDEQFCAFFSMSVGIKKACYAVARDGDDMRFILIRWEQPGHIIQRPHQWVPVAQLYHTPG